MTHSSVPGTPMTISTMPSRTATIAPNTVFTIRYLRTAFEKRVKDSMTPALLSANRWTRPPNPPASAAMKTM